MSTETQIIIERRESGSSRWERYCSCQRDGEDFTDESVINECGRLAARYNQHHFRAVRIVTTREVLR